MTLHPRGKTSKWTAAGQSGLKRTTSSEKSIEMGLPGGSEGVAIFE